VYTMKAVQKFIDELTNELGSSKLSVDLPTRIAYRAAHGPEALLHSNLDAFTPAVVARPYATEDVVKIVRCCDRYEIPIVSGGKDRQLWCRGFA